MRAIRRIIPVLVLLSFFGGRALAASMGDYCVVPPYVKTDVDPNILFVLDNSYINGKAAYSDGVTVGGNLYYVPPASGDAPHAGLFDPELWYYYDGSKFVPSRTNSAAVFDGDLLNWIATSRYDLLIAVLEGGKSSSRQAANVNTLVGFNSGTWTPKYFEYTGTDGNPYSCAFTVNIGNRGDITVSDYAGVFGDTCGLIASTPVRPGSGYYYPVKMASAAAPEASTAYAALGAEEGGGATKSRTFNLVNGLMSSLAETAEAAKPLAIITPKDSAMLPGATRYLPYVGFACAASGGAGSPPAYTWSATGLPTGLSMSAGGIISGTPTAAPATYTVTITVGDGTSTVSVTAFLTVAGNLLSVVSPVDSMSLPDATRYQPYAGYTAIASGGTGMYSWSASGLPAGLSMSAGGYISGTPTAAPGTYTVTVQVTDTASSTASVTVSLVVRGTALQITAPAAGSYLPDATRLSAISPEPYVGYTATASGGTGSYTWSATGLPTGLSIDPVTGYISGAVTAAAGTYTIIIMVGDGADTASVTAYIMVYEPPVEITWPYDDPLTAWADFMLGDNILNAPYTGRFQPMAQGGSGTYTWNYIGLPNGFTFDPATGLLYGMPNDPLQLYLWFEVTITVTDGVGWDSAMVGMYVFTANHVSIVTAWDGDPMPAATEGQPYPGFSIGTFYGGGQNRWEATGLPTGLAIDQDTGLVTGTTTEVGSHIVTFTVYDNYTGLSWDGITMCPCSATVWMTLEVLPATLPAIVITSPVAGSSLPGAYSGVPYAGFSSAATGGSGPYTWSQSGLPSGLSIDPLTGYISGNTTAVGTYSVTVTVTDSLSNTASANASLRVYNNNALLIKSPAASGSLPDAQVGKLYVGYSPAATGGTGAYSWSAIGLPLGLGISASTGLISGTPAVGTEGTYSVVITVSDGASTPVSVTVGLEVLPSDVNIRTFNIRVCAGDYDNNCNGGTFEKRGLLQDFWQLAKFGLLDFANSLDPSIEVCLPAGNEENFHTNVENAVPVGSDSTFTKLINSEFQGVKVFMGQNSPPVCEPFPSPTESGLRCKKNFILILTDGSGAASGTTVFGSPPNNNPPLPATCSTLSSALAKNACFGYVTDLRSTTLGASDRPGDQIVSTYIVHAGSTNAAILQEATENSGGRYYSVSDPKQLRDKIKEALQDMITRAASGTAASVLASGEGSGANLVQAVYYPRRRVKDSATDIYDEITWSGRLTNLWYFIDPFFGTSNIYADTDQNKTLNTVLDDSVRLYFDDSEMATKAALTNTTGTTEVYMENVKNLWEAGLELWKRDVASDPRTIYANISNTPTMTAFTNSLATDPGVRTLLQASTEAEARDIINYIHGFDLADPNKRSRAIKVDLNGDGDTADAGETVKNVWKLGDVINSTPRISSWLQLNYYDVTYGDSTYWNRLGTGFIDSALYTQRGMVFTGGNDGMLHAFNLGDLQLRGDPDWASPAAKDVARIVTAAGTYGREMWTFIPKNALPYLRYQTEGSYCHVYTVDLSPYLFDASIGNPIIDEPGYCGSSSYWNCNKEAASWRTVLIGGMRTGGACKNSTTACTQDLNGDGTVDSTDCVNTPIADVGYSSYFALDVTDPSNPRFMWEFTNAGLGFSTTGPAIVRINGWDDTDSDGVLDVGTEFINKNKNGRWFVVVGSGPTGPIDTVHEQFLGNSDQPLQFFVLDLKTGQLVRTITGADTGITNAFAGSMINVTNDSNLNYSDDALYVGYTKRTGTSPNYTWTDGGVGRILTKESVNPSEWTFSKVIDGTGPVTSSIVRLQDNTRDELWIYFGTGRSFYKIQSSIDDHGGQRHIFGLKDPCFRDERASYYPFNLTCSEVDFNIDPITGAATSNNLDDMTYTASIVHASDPMGWFISLDDDGAYTYYNDAGDPVTKNYSAERVVTDPVASVSGVVFFTTHKPYNGECDMGGKSFIWALEYSTGGDAGARLKGSALIQVSTGAIEKVDLATAFTDRDNRRTGSMEGVPPTAQGFSLFLPPPPLKRVVHTRER